MVCRAWGATAAASRRMWCCCTIDLAINLGAYDWCRLLAWFARRAEAVQALTLRGPYDGFHTLLALLSNSVQVRVEL